MWIFDKIVDGAGAALGYLEMLGLKYPVKEYRSQVSDGLWRGSRLDADDVLELKALGISLVVNLCAENDADAHCGIQTLHIRIIDNEPPKLRQVVEFLSAVARPENQPAYVHCEAGKGRTGVMVACYRVSAQGWSADDAIKEAEKMGMAMPDQEEFIREFAAKWLRGEISLIGRVV